MAIRKYSSTVDSKTLAVAVTSAGQSTLTLNNITNLPPLLTGQTFTLVINPDTSSEEIVTVTSYGSGNVVNVTRGSDSTTAQSSHAVGSVVKHMITARDLQEPQNHIDASANVHGLGSGSAVVGTIDSQTLTNKTLTSPTVNTPVVSGGTFSSPAITGGTIAGTVTNSGTISGGTVSGVTISGSNTNSGTITGGTYASPAITLSGGGSIGLGSASAPITANSLSISATNVSHLYNSTSNIQDQLNSKPTVKMQSGSDTTASIATGTITTKSVTFTTAFTSGTTPVVTVTPIRSFSSNSSLFQMTLNANPTNTGFVVQFINNTGSTIAMPFNWIAVGS